MTVTTETAPSPTFTPAATPAPVRPKRSVKRRVLRALVFTIVGYVVLWAVASLGILAASKWAQSDTPVPAGTPVVQGVNNFRPVDSDGHLWRGAAPSPEGYRNLAEIGVTTVVDLRGEDLSAAQLASPGKAGLELVRMPVRDGQTPTQAEVKEFLDIVSSTSGKVYVHCGAGVGRTGAMVAAYLVQTGEASPATAVKRNLSVGPPSVEQIWYGLTLNKDEAEQPPVAVEAVSRLIDAPRRIMSYL
ncbi:dual specificity protein phosphatase family protein [Streptomyces sp. NPDC058739]|uniref:protein-tyrosine phosphatase family protein n=1 Tax=Streptomyces sp. NPDC058739 TaxID=3346618 RepID=UPI0036D04EAC